MFQKRKNEKRHQNLHDDAAVSAETARAADADGDAGDAQRRLAERSRAHGLRQMALTAHGGICHTPTAETGQVSRPASRGLCGAGGHALPLMELLGPYYL